MSEMVFGLKNLHFRFRTARLWAENRDFRGLPGGKAPAWASGVGSGIQDWLPGVHPGLQKHRHNDPGAEITGIEP